MLQYRVTVQGDRQQIFDQMPDWAEIAYTASERGMNVKLESRSIFEFDTPEALQSWLPCIQEVDADGNLTGKMSQGWMVFGCKLISPWFYEAAVIERDENLKAIAA